MIAAGPGVTHRSDPYRAPATAAAAFLQPLKLLWDMDNSNKSEEASLGMAPLHWTTVVFTFVEKYNSYFNGGVFHCAVVAPAGPP